MERNITVIRSGRTTPPNLLPGRYCPGTNSYFGSVASTRSLTSPGLYSGRHQASSATSNSQLGGLQFSNSIRSYQPASSSQGPPLPNNTDNLAGAGSQFEPEPINGGSDLCGGGCGGPSSLPWAKLSGARAYGQGRVVGPSPEQVQPKIGSPLEWTLHKFNCPGCGEFQMYRYHLLSVDMSTCPTAMAGFDVANLLRKIFGVFNAFRPSKRRAVQSSSFGSGDGGYEQRLPLRSQYQSRAPFQSTYFTAASEQHDYTRHPRSLLETVHEPMPPQQQVLSPSGFDQTSVPFGRTAPYDAQREQPLRGNISRLRESHPDQAMRGTGTIGDSVHNIYQQSQTGDGDEGKRIKNKRNMDHELYLKNRRRKACEKHRKRHTKCDCPDDEEETQPTEDDGASHDASRPRNKGAEHLTATDALNDLSEFDWDITVSDLATADHDGASSPWYSDRGKG